MRTACRWLGVDKVYLTENDAEAPLREVLQPWVDEGFLEYKVEGEPQAQLRVYTRCLKQHRHQYNWMAFFDVDEYLILRNKKALLSAVICRCRRIACYSAFPCGLPVIAHCM